MLNGLPNDSSETFFVAFDLFHKCVTRVIDDNRPHRSLDNINPFLSILYTLDLPDLGVQSISGAYVAMMESIIGSNHPIEARCHSAKLVMHLLDNPEIDRFFSFATYGRTLLRFLELCEDHYRSSPPFASVPELHIPSGANPEIIAIQILRISTGEECDLTDLAPMLISVLTRILRPDDRLRARALGLGLFARLCRCRPSLPISDGITPQVCARLMDAIGDPLQQSETPVDPLTLTNTLSLFERYGDGIDQYNNVGILLGLTMSDVWRDHLRPSNFASCAEIMSRELARRQVLDTISRIAKIVTDSTEGQDRSAMLVKALDRLKGLGNPGAVQFMLLHIWSSNGMYLFKEETWKWLKTETLELFYTHGTEYLDAFAMHIRNGFCPGATVTTTAFKFRGADSAQCRVRVRDWGGMLETPGLEKVQAMCIVRGLYQAVGWDPARKEAGVLPVVDMAHV